MKTIIYGRYYDLIEIPLFKLLDTPIEKLNTLIHKLYNSICEKMNSVPYS